MPPKAIPNTLPGTVLPQYVRCGKAGCHCARGELHGPYWYRFWREDGYTLRKEYVRKADLAAVRAACEAYAEEVREGRTLIRQARPILRWLADDGDAPIEVRRITNDLLLYPDIVRALLEYVEGKKGSLAIQIRALLLLLDTAVASRRRNPGGAEMLLRR